MRINVGIIMPWRSVSDTISEPAFQAYRTYVTEDGHMILEYRNATRAIFPVTKA